MSNRGSTVDSNWAAFGRGCLEERTRKFLIHIADLQTASHPHSQSSSLASSAQWASIMGYPPQMMRRLFTASLYPPKYEPNETTEETDVYENEPYAQLIYRALMSAPGYRLALQEIYQWFMTHTTKARGPPQKGWQNSIRHNLSMNGVSELVGMGRKSVLNLSRRSEKLPKLPPRRTGKRISCGC